MTGRLLVPLLLATGAWAQSPAARVADDAMVIDRVAEASKKDLPRDLLKRIIDEDIDLLRGKRTDGSFEYATYENLEAGRSTQSFSIQPKADKMETIEMRGELVYRALLEVPNRRMLVRRNRPVWIERVDVEFLPLGQAQIQRQGYELKVWLQPGEVKPIDLPVVARQATVRVVATADPKGGYANLDVSLVHAKIVDNSDSPYADAVASAKALQRALDNNDVKSIRAMAQRLRGAAAAPGRWPVAEAATAPPSGSSIDVRPDKATQLELQTELQLIEDLLTGNESERREGMDKLHQLIRRTRK